MRLMVAALVLVLTAQAQDRAGQWLEDLTFLQYELTTRHPRLREGVDHEALVARIDTLRTVTGTWSDPQMAAGIAEALAILEEAHTNLSLSSYPALFPRLPIAMRWFSDGLFVSSASDALSPYIGAQVLRIGSMTAEEAHTAIRRYISTENDAWAREISRVYLTLPDLLALAGISESATSARFTLAMPKGGEATVDIAPGGSVAVAGPLSNYRPEPHYLRSPTYYYWFDFLADSRTLYIKYNQCVEMTAISWNAFLDELTAAAGAWPIERIVIDLRDNAGGSSRYIPLLLARLNAQGFVHFPRGKFAITGRRTASSGVLAAIQLKEAGYTTVGEGTGGKPSSWGEVLRLVLPHSKLAIAYSTRFVSVPGHDEPSLLPDIAVDFPSSLFLESRDAYLEAILSR